MNNKPKKEDMKKTILFINENGSQIKTFESFCDIRRNLATSSREDLPLAQMVSIPARLHPALNRLREKVSKRSKSTTSKLVDPCILIDEEARFHREDGGTYFNATASRLFGQQILGGVAIINGSEIDDMNYGEEVL